MEEKLRVHDYLRGGGLTHVHPILEGRGNRFYLATWAVIGTVQVAILNQYYEIPLNPALLDSLVFNSFFLILGIGYWYVIRYALPKVRDITRLVSWHVLVAFIAISGTIYLGEFILGQILISQINYLDFLEGTIIWRGLVGVLYYAVIMLIYYLIQHYQDLQEKLSIELELKSIIKESELKMLKSQINPHFIFNSLNSISSLILSSPEDARAMIIKMSGFLRYSLGQDNEQISLREELDQINRYLDIEKVRFGDQLVIERILSADCLEWSVPRLILQPLFENAIKYGLYESIERVIISFACTKKGTNLLLTISNSFDPTAIVENGTGIGLSNIRQRLNLHYGDPDLLTTKIDGTLFVVHLTIPQSN